MDYEICNDNDLNISVEGMLALQNSCANNANFSDTELTEYKTFHFVRHGETPWNKDMLTAGPLDLSLNARGFAQAHNAIHTLQETDISIIISSPLRRCLQTATVLSQTLDVPIIIAEELEERQFGDWSKCKKEAEQLAALAPEGPEFFRYIKTEIENILPPDAESQEKFSARIIQGFNKYLHNYTSENILFVGHGCVEKVIVSATTPPNVIFAEYGKPVTFNASDTHWKLYMLGK